MSIANKYVEGKCKCHVNKVLLSLKIIQTVQHSEISLTHPEEQRALCAAHVDQLQLQASALAKRVKLMTGTCVLTKAALC